MKILVIRTDKPEAEIGLFDEGTELGYEVWQAHRKLAETLHERIDSLLTKHQTKLTDLDGLVVYEGPGSFTGLRIGMSVANALAYSYQLPIAAATGDDWIRVGVKHLGNIHPGTWVAPMYGGEAHITKPKK